MSLAAVSKCYGLLRG
jgi:AP-3 complex subunit delta-1